MRKSTNPAILGIFSTAILVGCASTPPSTPCEPLKTVLPHTSLEQSALADELAEDGPESQLWLEEYTGLRAAGAVVCPAPEK